MAKPKRFNCIELQRRGAKLVYEQTKDMTLEEQVAFWHKGTEELLELQQAIRSQKKDAKEASMLDRLLERPKKKKKFDCVELQHRGAKLVYEQTKDMTPEEQVAFWQERTEELRQRQQAIRSQRKDAKELSMLDRLLAE